MMVKINEVKVLEYEVQYMFSYEMQKVLEAVKIESKITVLTRAENKNRIIIGIARHLRDSKQVHCFFLFPLVLGKM